jgi:hypothetical protein
MLPALIKRDHVSRDERIVSSLKAQKGLLDVVQVLPAASFLVIMIDGGVTKQLPGYVVVEIVYCAC